jgi:hypothetical protein
MVGTYSISPSTSESEAQSDAAFFLLLQSHKYNSKKPKGKLTYGVALVADRVVVTRRLEERIRQMGQTKPRNLPLARRRFRLNHLSIPFAIFAEGVDGDGANNKTSDGRFLIKRMGKY